MVGWHHLLSGHEFEQTPGDSEGQGSLACRSPWGGKELDMTQWLNNIKCFQGFPKWLSGKRICLPRQESEEKLVQSLGQEDPLEEGNGNSLKYSCLENPMDRGAWRTTVHKVTKCQTRLNNWTCVHACFKRT